MFIPAGFDEANAQRRKRIYNISLRTASKLNQRMLNFLTDVDKNASISKDQKAKIRQKLIENI